MPHPAPPDPPERPEGIPGFPRWPWWYAPAAFGTGTVAIGFIAGIAGAMYAYNFGSVSDTTFGALAALGVEANEVHDVILTHLHFDHAEGLAAWPQRRVFAHRLETEAPYAQIVAGVLEMVELEVLDGDEGEIERGVRWLRTPGHSDGLISLLVDTDEGLTVIASDCVGPLPEYFDQMDLPPDFGPERDELLTQWRRIRDLDPAVVIPGHNPPVTLR
jgi:glyoxylase-like metal-dependent hydrolase (beta-lactamase superfamily II)